MCSCEKHLISRAEDACLFEENYTALLLRQQWYMGNRDSAFETREDFLCIFRILRQRLSKATWFSSDVIRVCIWRCGQMRTFILFTYFNYFICKTLRTRTVSHCVCSNAQNKNRSMVRSPGASIAHKLMVGVNTRKAHLSQWKNLFIILCVCIFLWEAKSNNKKKSHCA